MAGSLRARKFGQHYYLVAKMSDDTERIISMNGGVFPLGVVQGEGEVQAVFEFVPSPLQDGTTEQPDPSLLPTLEDASESNPSDLAVLPAEFGFSGWYYNPPSEGEPASAQYTVGVYAMGVDMFVAGQMVSGDSTPMRVEIG